MALGVPLAAAGCAGLARQDQGVLQPQSVSGPCTVDKFYLLGVTTVHTGMAVGRGGQACTFTVLNPDLQVFPAAALVTSRPAHGVTQAELVASGRQVAISYTAQPGYTGPDRFVVTIEPNAQGIEVAVTVR